MKVVVLGSNGMLGHMVYHYLNETGKYEVTGLTRKEYPINDRYMNDMSDYFRPSCDVFNSDIIVNCIGMLMESNRPENKLEAIYVNSIFPNELAKCASISNTKVIHISTDCVYSGVSYYPFGGYGSYNKTQFPNPSDTYGMTKWLGEIDAPHCTLRQSVIGPQLIEKKSGLMNWVLSLGDNEKVPGYSYNWWNGLTALQLAKDIELIIDKEQIGLISNGTKAIISKHDLVKLIAEKFSKKIDIYPSNEVQKNMLIKATIHEKDGLDMSNMLDELKIWMKNHINLYKHYERYLND